MNQKKQNSRPAKQTGVYTYYLESEDARLKINDPRITHVIAYNLNQYETRIQQNIFQKKGMRLRAGSRIDHASIKYAQKFCSGRECLAFYSLVGNIYKDLQEDTPENEITVYWSIDQCGPCQVGAWPGVLDVLLKNNRTAKKRLFTGHPNVRNNYFNLGYAFVFDYITAHIVGSILEEARNVLYAAARDREQALALFEAEARLLIRETEKGMHRIWGALRRWAGKMRQIPLKTTVQEIPKILIFGGNAPFFNQVFVDYFLEKGVIVKSDIFADYLLHVESECMRRFGIRRGITDIRRQRKVLPMLLSCLNPRYRWSEVYDALVSTLSVSAIDFLFKRLRQIAWKSGLLFDEHHTFIDLLAAGDTLIDVNNYCDSTPAIGRFMLSFENDIYDGMVYITPFSCIAGILGETLIKTVVNKHDVVCATIEISDLILTTENKKILENLLVQARRRKAKKLAKPL